MVMVPESLASNSVQTTSFLGSGTLGTSFSNEEKLPAHAHKRIPLQISDQVSHLPHRNLAFRGRRYCSVRISQPGDRGSHPIPFDRYGSGDHYHHHWLGYFFSSQAKGWYR